MAFPAATVWEARSAGNSTVNGAAYVPGLGGTDYSQQDAAQLTLSDVVTTGGSAVITSATGGFTSQMVGNGLSLNESGVFRWYYVVTFTSTNQVTLDQNVVGGSLTGVALRLGGAANIQNSGAQFQAFVAPGNKVWEKGSFTHATNGVLWSVSGTQTQPITVEGYTTTRGDGGFATHTRTSTNIDVVEVSGNFRIVRNLICDQGDNFNTCFKLSGFACTVENVLARMALTSSGTGGARFLVNGGNNRLYRCRADGQSLNGYGFLASGNHNRFDHCEAYGSNELAGFHSTGSGVYLHHCVSRDNTGAGSDGVFLNDQPATIEHCDISRNGRDGIRLGNANDALTSIVITANIFNRNGQTAGYEINYSPANISTNTGAIQAALVNIRNNAFYVTGSGKSNNLPPFSGDVTLSADPFIDSGGGSDFTLNNTAGGGAVLRATQAIVAMPGGVGTDYRTIGALGTTGGVTPMAPSALAVTVVSSTQVNLTWTDNSTDEIYFFVERADNGGSFAVIATLAPGTTSYSDTDVTANNRYQYRVRVVN